VAHPQSAIESRLDRVSPYRESAIRNPQSAIESSPRQCSIATVRVLIIGCGYVGLPLGIELLRQGHAVWGLRRSATGAAAMQAAGLQPITADITRPGDLAKLPLPCDWIVNTISAGAGGAEEYQKVYFEGTRNLLQWLASAPPKKFIHIGSTAVYGQTDASQVTETSPAEPVAPTGRILLAAEKLLLDAFRDRQFPAILLRVAGIYGPGRGHYLLQFLKGGATIPGRGEHFLNMIHRDDVIGGIVTALKSRRAGEIYNLADDEPVRQIHFFRWLSETLGKPMPPFVPESRKTAAKRGDTNKRVLNRKLKMELGCVFRYPTFCQGCTAEIQRLQDAGATAGRDSVEP
jgi:nucleoside-diphosphate-sugar epimerase